MGNPKSRPRAGASGNQGATNVSFLRRVRWTAVLGVGLVLLSIIILVTFLILLVFIAPAISVLGEDEVFWSTWRIVRRVCYISVPLGLLYAGLILAEGNKISVLYLRRFGLNVNVIGPRYGRGLGRNIRLFTLDDRKFSPSAAPAFDVWLGRLIPVLVLVILIIIGVSIAGGRSWATSSEAREPVMIGTLISLWFGTGIAFFILFSFLLHEYRMWRWSRMVIYTHADLESASAVARAASQWWTRPALLGREATVFSANNKLWQAAVERISRDTNVVLVDVSDRSNNVEWELNFLRIHKIPHLLIAEHQLVTCQSQVLDGTIVDENKTNARFFTYDLNNKASLKKFRSAVAAELRRRARPVESITPCWKNRIRSVTHLIMIYVVILMLAATAAVGAARLAVNFYLPLLR